MRYEHDYTKIRVRDEHCYSKQLTNWNCWKGDADADADAMARWAEMAMIFIFGKIEMRRMKETLSLLLLIFYELKCGSSRL